MIIGLAGAARSGKDTVAGIMREHHGFSHVAFADPLRNFLEAQDPFVKHNKVPVYTRLSNVLRKYGWQGYKSSPYSDDVRALIQRTGTEAGRDKVDKNIWINATIMNMPKGDVVVSDCRFPDEVHILRAGQAKIIRIIRPEAGLPGEHGTHSSEQVLPDELFDFTIVNDGTIDDLKMKVNEILKSLRA